MSILNSFRGTRVSRALAVFLASATPLAASAADLSNGIPISTDCDVTMRPDSSVATVTTYQYATLYGVDLDVDLYLPTAATKPPPVVMSIHGGGFTKFLPQTRAKLDDEAYQLAALGYAVAVIEYPLLNAYTGDRAFPAGLQGALCALRFLKAKGASLGIDASRVVAKGSSAGASLSALLATIADNAASYDNPDCPYNKGTDARLRGSVNLYGFYDLTQFGPGSVFAPYIQARNPVLRDRIGRAASALYQADKPTTPPMLFSRGELDGISRAPQTDAMYQRTVDLGIPSAYITVPNGRHGYTIFSNADNFAAEMCTTVNFLKAALRP